MTDNEILKALECCSAKGKCVRCTYDHFSDDCDGCTSILAKDSLDLINRQKAEIERLHSEVKEKTEAIVFLKNQATGWSIDFCNLKQKLNTAKAEAINEFAERAGVMITEVYNKHIFGNNDLEAEEKDAIINFSDDITRGFDGLVKEMTEESDGKL